MSESNNRNWRKGHVQIRDYGLDAECLQCGQRVVYATLTRLESWKALFKTFVHKHEDCTEITG